MRQLLGAYWYQHLTIFVAYVKTCHIWMEAHPEASYRLDRRVVDHFEPLITDEPALADFFQHYHQQVAQEAQHQAALAERRQHEQLIRRSEARFQAALDSSLDAFFILESVRESTGPIVDFTFVERRVSLRLATLFVLALLCTMSGTAAPFAGRAVPVQGPQPVPLLWLDRGITSFMVE